MRRHTSADQGGGGAGGPRQLPALPRVQLNVVDLHACNTVPFQKMNESPRGRDLNTASSMHPASQKQYWAQGWDPLLRACLSRHLLPDGHGGQRQRVARLDAGTGPGGDAHAGTHVLRRQHIGEAPKVACCRFCSAAGSPPSQTLIAWTFRLKIL